MIISVNRADIRNAKKARQDFHDGKTTYYSRPETHPIAFALCRYWGVSNRGQYMVLTDGIYIAIAYIFKYYISDEVVEFIEEADRKKDNIRPRNLEIPVYDPRHY